MYTNIENSELYMIDQYTFSFRLENNKIEMAEHTGTHVDSPAHLGIEGQWRVDDIPIGNLMGPGVVINIVDKAKENPNYAITIDDVKKWESKNGKIPKGAVVLMNAGWGDRYQEGMMAVVGTKTNLTDPSTYNHPGFGEDTVEWIMDNRDVHAIGSDGYNFDTAKATHFPVHRLLSINSKCGLENVANVDKVPEAGAMIYIGLIKIKDGSGGPARIFAIVDDDTNSATKTSLPLAVLFTFLVLYRVSLS